MVKFLKKVFTINNFIVFVLVSALIYSIIAMVTKDEAISEKASRLIVLGLLLDINLKIDRLKK